MEKFSEETNIAVMVQDQCLELKPPSQFAVIIHNDDLTSMEFVVEMLKRFFYKQHDEAVQIMLKVQNEGRGIGGIYNYEIAETKIFQVHQCARLEGFPLTCTMEVVK